MMVAMNDDEYVPERNWRDRASPILFIPGVPHDIIHEYLEVKKRFGIDIANLVLFTYKQWGRRVAKNLANKILRFDSFDELVRFLESKINMFDTKSKKVLSGLIYSFKYSYFFDTLLSIVNNNVHDCPTARDIAIKVFHCLASKGLFYSPDCIVEYAVIRARCRDNGRVRAKCRSVTKNISAYCEDVLG